jgi:hypothetical protein
MSHFATPQTQAPKILVRAGPDAQGRRLEQSQHSGEKTPRSAIQSAIDR